MPYGEPLLTGVPDVLMLASTGDRADPAGPPGSSTGGRCRVVEPAAAGILGGLAGPDAPAPPAEDARAYRVGSQGGQLHTRLRSP